MSLSVRNLYILREVCEDFFYILREVCVGFETRENVYVISLNFRGDQCIFSYLIYINVQIFEQLYLTL